MKKLGIGEERLEPNDRIFNNDISVFTENRELLIGLSVSIFFAMYVISVLLALIGRLKKTQNILEKNEIRYRDMAMAGAHILWETDTEGRFTYISGDTENMFNMSNLFMLGKSGPELRHPTSKNEVPWDDIYHLLLHRKPINNQVAKLNLPGQIQKVVAISGKPLFSSDEKFEGYRGIAKEITNEHKLAQKIAFEASHDLLTGLINRRSFHKQCKDLMDNPDTEVYETSIFMCYLDLDNFKMVNDTAGHTAGDSMLTGVTSIVLNTIDENDILGRLGGDEFGLILINKTQAEVEYLCNKIITSVSQYRLFWNDNYYNVGVSLGVVKFISGISYEELLSQADLACYKAKEQGKNRFYIFHQHDPDMQEEREQLGHIANISDALQNNQFYLAKQLIKPLKESSFQPHYEVLLRYQDKEGNLIPPGLFIPAAEKYGAIMQIDKWVVEMVVTHYNELFDGEDPIVSVNLSGVSLSNNNFIDEILEIFQRTDCDLRNICFEITETAVISHIKHALRFIREMKKFGCKFALDDFGSGASSYGYLRKLPVDYLKIDGSLIRAINSEPVDYSIVKSINEIAQQMGMETIAEFVENSEIETLLQEMGINYGQGFGIHKPEPCMKVKSCRVDEY